MAAPCYVGTSGWSYPSGYGRWTGIFYPRGWRGDDLAYYAERFPAVEVNATFYRTPARATVRSWVDRTPPHFRFTAKLHRKFTHPGFYAREENASPEITPEDVRAVRELLETLAESDRLGSLLIQYPDFHTASEANAADLVRVLDTFRPFPTTVEIRHPSWLRPRTFDLLAHYGAGLARIDEPGFSTLTDPMPDTGGPRYFRFHGRNRVDWNAPGAGARRYDYLYSGKELSSLADAVDRTVGDAPVFAFFNNHPNSKAAANAIQLAARLGLPIPYGKLGPLVEKFPDLRELLGPPGGQSELF